MASDKKARAKKGLAAKSGSVAPQGVVVGGPVKAHTKKRATTKGKPKPKTKGKKVKKVPARDLVHGAPPMDAVNPTNEMPPVPPTKAQQVHLSEVANYPDGKLEAPPNIIDELDARIDQAAGSPAQAQAPDPVTDADIPTKTPADNATPTIKTGSGRLLQGAQCTFLGWESNCPDDSASGAPICPYCTGGLLEVPGGEAMMTLGIEQYELGAYPTADAKHPPKPHVGYGKMIAWLRSQSCCYTSLELAAGAYEADTGNHVDVSR